jgi:hypothetical protein
VCGAKDELADIMHASKDEVGGGGKHHGHLGRKPQDGVANALVASVPDPNMVAPVRLEGRSNVPAVFCMR